MRPEEFDTPSLRQPDPAESTVSDRGNRALVALSPTAESFESKIACRHAPFLAQLAATKDGHPQTRERRRAEPDVALAAYRATAALTQLY